MKKSKGKNTEIGLDLQKDSDVIEITENKYLQISALEQSLSESEDKYMRLYSDFENYKRRVGKEKEEIKNNTKVSMVTSVLDMDNDIELAIKNIKDEDAKQGVQLIANKIQTFLKSHGIDPIQTEVYDEDLHEVISVIEIGESKIVDVVSKGYTLNGSPFRFPKIVLGK